MKKKQSRLVYIALMGEYALIATLHVRLKPRTTGTVNRSEQIHSNMYRYHDTYVARCTEQERQDIDMGGDLSHLHAVQHMV